MKKLPLFNVNFWNSIQDLICCCEVVSSQTLCYQNDGPRNITSNWGDMLFLLAKFQYEFWKSTWPCSTLPKYKVWIVYSKMTALAVECGKRKKNASYTTYLTYFVLHEYLCDPLLAYQWEGECTCLYFKCLKATCK